MSLSLFIEDESNDDDYFDADLRRHDVPDICSCTHQRADHSHNDGGCARLGCTCRWFEDVSFLVTEDGLAWPEVGS